MRKKAFLRDQSIGSWRARPTGGDPLHKPRGHRDSASRFEPIHRLIVLKQGRRSRRVKHDHGERIWPQDGLLNLNAMSVSGGLEVHLEEGLAQTLCAGFPGSPASANDTAPHGSKVGRAAAPVAVQLLDRLASRPAWSQAPPRAAPLNPCEPPASVGAPAERGHITWDA